MEQSQTPAHATAQDHAASETSETKVSVRPSVSSLLPTSNEPETAAQRRGERRNGAYKETVAVKRVDPQAEEARRRVMITLGLEVALAMCLTLASRLWAWAQEERAHARVDRALRRRMPAT